MKNIPDKIYLQVGDEVEPDDDFNKCAKSYEITWSDSRIFKNDIVYYRSKRKRGKTKSTAR